LTQSISESLQDIIKRVEENYFPKGYILGERKPYTEQHPLDEIKDPKPIILPGVSTKYQGCSFDNFQGNKNLVSDMKAIGKESVVLSGKTGCGKTHIAVSMLRESGLKWTGYFITIPELLLKIRGAFNSQSSETEEEIIKKFSDYDLLVLDDLGAEKTTEYSITTLYLILDRRNRENKRTIVTTNLSLQDIEETLGARIASRLSDMKFIKINMQDYRKNR
jgi:DNA replication protein DnaC